MQRINWDEILKYGILPLTISSVGQWLRIPIGPTVLWWSLYAIMIIAMIRLRDKSNVPLLYFVWIAYVVISSIVGTTFCRDYWDWKMLVGNMFGFSICLVAVSTCVPELLRSILGVLYKHIWKIFLLLAFFLQSDGIAKFMIPFTFLALLYPLLNAKYRKYMWAGALITLLFGYDSRADLLKFLFCILLGVISVRHDIVRYARKWYWVFYVLPFLLFALAANGTFNIFRMGEMLRLGDENRGRIETADTRTLLYEEVISTSQERGTIWFGGTPARGYYSEWFITFGDDSEVMGDMHYGERSGTECSILNVFLYFGIIGVLIYMMVFGVASYWGIFKSNNVYLPVIGLYVAFRFLVGWIEDFNRFDLNMFFLWAMIGMCYSSYFRGMSNDEFCEWFNDIMV